MFSVMKSDFPYPLDNPTPSQEYQPNGFQEAS